MAKINVTTTLATKLKEIRVKSGIKSKDIALHIGKSAAYITKLEKGDIKQLDQNVLMGIIEYITEDNEGFSKFIEDVAISSEDTTLKEDEWFMNFDLIERMIPIPKLLIEYIRSHINSLNISIHELTSYINRNEDLDNEFFFNVNVNPNDIEKNTWYIRQTVVDCKNISNQCFIIVSYTEEEIESIVSGKSDVCNHTIMFAIIYHIIKLEYAQGSKEKTGYDMHDEASSILQKHKFYSLVDRLKIVRQAKTQEEYEDLLSDFDRRNQEIITGILGHISYLSDYDIKYTNSKLEKVLENLENERSFALSFMATPLVEIKQISVLKKKNFLDEIKELIRKYSISDGEEIELY